ncbi:TonB-dependent receptor [Novosphingobium bradum]|uniref:TonB-dependent receptor n=1 Tax=Novosphingobium bradum TaxID=1737444 RepID=A0ABV7IXF4_9SPHN
MRRLPSIASSLLALAAAAPIFADPAADGSADPHDHVPQEIVVTGALRQSRLDALSGVAVIQGARLDQAIRPSIGDTLEHTAGVSSTSFGPTASRPVLRGMQGERVRLLTDGIGAIDVSNTSADHAAVVNPLLAERIEVLRGPQSLLYGASAIGGVVNVIDRRIPTSLPTEPVHLGAVAGYGSAAHERSAAGSVEVPLGGGFVAHGDGSYDKSDDLAIGGFALTPTLRAQALATAASGLGDPAIAYAANAAQAGVLPNTAARTWTAGGGLSYINDRGMLGASYTHSDSLYGVPVRLATRPGDGEEAPRLAMRQDRLDLRAEVKPGGAIDHVLLRAAWADYRHSELAPDGSVGTTFLDKGIEARLEVAQARRGGWQGASGAQFVNRDFDVIGDEAFLPKNGTQAFGLFTVQQVELGGFKLEAGARFEHTRIAAMPGPAQPQFAAGARRFDTVSLSGGAAWAVRPGWRLGLNLSRTERAPAAEELFANGPHAGTEAFEIGNPAFGIERATSLEAILKGGDADFGLEASAYYTWFANFIYDARTGAVIDGLPVYQGRQGDARWLGFEVEGHATLARLGGWTLAADGLADAVRATISSYGPAPRIPPLRLLGGLEAKSRKLDLRAEVEQVTAQHRVAPNETPTPAYTLINASASWRPWGEDRPLSFTLSANNLLDVAARRHASFLKDYAPLAGRDIRLTARLEL